MTFKVVSQRSICTVNGMRGVLVHLSAMDRLGADGEDGREASKHVESGYVRAYV